MRRPAMLALAATALLFGCRDNEPTVLMPDGPQFAKMNGNDFYQCQTGKTRLACSWVSANLNKSHNVYFEDDVIPQKIRLDEAVGHTRVILEYGFRKGGTVTGPGVGVLSGSYNGNYDFMASYDAGTGPNNPCTGDSRWDFFCAGGALKAFNNTNFPGGVTNFQIPDGPKTGLTPQELAAYNAALARYGAVKRKLLVLNAQNVSMEGPTFTRSGDATTARVVIYFDAPQSPADGSQVGVVFGMHFAYGGDWNTNDNIWHGASGQSGSPFHTKIIEVRTGIPCNQQGNCNYNQGKVLNNGAMAINVSGDVVLLPSLQAEKEAAVSVVNSGEEVSYTIAVINTGLGAASNVVITDNLPGNPGLLWSLHPADTPSECAISGNQGSQVLSCTWASVPAPGQVSVTVKSPTTAATCGTISNTASVTASGSPVSGDLGPIEITVNCPDVSLAKEEDDDQVTAGNPIGFTVTVSNAGPGKATGVTVSDPLPTAFTWSIASTTPANDARWTLDANTKILTFSGDLDVNESSSVHITAPTLGDVCGLVENTATGTVANGDDPAPAEADLTINCTPELTLAKSALPLTYGNVGDVITYSYLVTNTGNVRLAGPVTIDDDKIVSPNTATCPNVNTVGNNDGFLDPGESITCTASYTITLADIDAGSVTNTATASADGTESNEDDATVTVLPPELEIEKTPDEGDTDYIVHPGGTASFTIVVRNVGQGLARNVTLSDVLPTEIGPWSIDPPNADCEITLGVLTCAVGDLAPGSQFSVSITASVPNDALQLPPSTITSPILIDGTLTGGVSNWFNVGISCGNPGPQKGCVLDVPSGRDDNSFKGGTKEDTQVPQIVTGSIPNNKSDLLRFYIAEQRVVDDVYLYLAWQRVQAPKGTTNMDFELNQSRTLSANGVTPIRTAGDLLIKYDLAQGGSSPTLGYHRWVTQQSAGGQTPAQACEASNTFPCWGRVQALAPPDVQAAVNTGTVVDPIWAVGQNADRNLDPYTFGEAAINLHETGIFTAGECISFGSAYLKSRSSSSFTSDVKDFIAPIAIEVESCEDVTIPNTATAEADNHAEVSDDGEILVTGENGNGAFLDTTAGANLAAAARLDAVRSSAIPFSVTFGSSLVSTLQQATAASARTVAPTTSADAATPPHHPGGPGVNGTGDG